MLVWNDLLLTKKLNEIQFVEILVLPLLLKRFGF